MKLHCPHCGVRGAAADSYLGKTVKCPKCQKLFIAAEPVTTAGTETAAPAAEAAPHAQTGEQRKIPPVDDAGLEEEKEAVPDWDHIAAEIEAQTAGDDLHQAGEMEELPDGLFAETTGARHAWPEARELGERPTPEVGDEHASVDASTGAESREDRLMDGDGATGAEPVRQVEDRTYGTIEEQCWQCGAKNLSGACFAASGDRLYCPQCAPAAEPLADFAGRSRGGPPPLADAEAAESYDSEDRPPRFTIGGVLREAWKKTAGAKGPILAGSAVMYLAFLFLGMAAGFLLPMFGYDLTAPATGFAAKSINFLFKALINIVYALFAAGLAFMGIRRAAGDPITWRLIFAGFADAGKIIVATILKFALIFIGFLILVLPGIYLAIGYSMTIPLIVDRKMSPWQAMETSRKAIHRIWWRVFGLYLVTGLLLIVSIVPLAIGLIWTLPMFVILTGVIYRHLFGAAK